MTQQQDKDVTGSSANASDTNAANAGFNETDGVDAFASQWGSEPAATSESIESGDATVAIPPKSHRPKPLLIAFLAVFVILALVAGITIARNISSSRAQAHADALQSCQDAQTKYATTVTTYTATMKAARELGKTPSDDVANTKLLDTLNDLAGTNDSAVIGLDLNTLNESDCSDNASTEDLDALAGSFGDAIVPMFKRTGEVQYAADNVKASIEDQKTVNVRSRLSYLVSTAQTVLDVSGGKVDESLRTALSDAIDAATALQKTNNLTAESTKGVMGDLQSAVDAVRNAMPLDCRLSKCVALTFDDGPDKTNTPKVLDALRQSGVPATFFVQGQNISGSNIDLLRREAAEGHEIGSMSWSHTQLHALSAGDLKTSLDKTASAIENATGSRPTLLRAPDGAWSDTVLSRAKADGLSLVLWNIDSQDWKSRDADAIVKQVVNTTLSGSIIDLHDTYGSTAAAIPQIVKQLQDQGYHFVTVSKLLEGGAKPGEIYYSAGDSSAYTMGVLADR